MKLKPYRAERRDILTGEISDSDGDAGDGEESEVVEGAKVSDDFGERRVPIKHWVLRLRRRCDVCVHRFRFTHSLFAFSRN